MYTSKFTLRYLFVACGVVVVTQATLLVANPVATVLSNLLTALAALLATTACLCAAFDEAAEDRKLWILLALAFLLSVVGQISSTYDDMTILTNTQTTALNADFLFFSYGIPILLAICSGGKNGGLRVFGWLDGAQGIVAAMLIYLQIFSALPSFGNPTPISARDLMYLYNGENLVLVGAVTLRLLSSPRGAKKRYYQVLTVYLWVYALIAALLGHFELGRNLPDGVQDAAWGIPILRGSASWPSDITSPRTLRQQ